MEDLPDVSREKNEIKKRPQFHFSCPKGWCNDPNGFSFFGNCFHLFYQWHPYSTVWGSMHWGHASTEDFVNWKILPTALTPDSAFDSEGCFSGTAIDYGGAHLLCYTGVTNSGGNMIQAQCIAIGDGTKYEKLGSNPVVDKKNVPFEFQVQDFRDPKIFKKNGNLYMLCVLKKNDGGGAMVLFRNEPNRKIDGWKFVGTLFESADGKTKMWECPDYFELDGKDTFLFSPQGMTEDFENGFHEGNNSVYTYGRLDLQDFNFTPQFHNGSFSYAQIDYGIDFYAPETTLSPDGRRIMIAWMSSWESPVTPEDFSWSGMMTFPRELFFRNERLWQIPVREIERFRKNHRTFEICCGSTMSLPVSDPRHFDCEIEFASDGIENDGGFFSIKIGDEKFFASLRYERKSGLLTFDRTNTIGGGGKIKKRSVKIKPDAEGKISLRILSDTNSLEAFVNGGELAFTNVFFIPPDSNGLHIKSTVRACVKIDYYEICVEDKK
ncbi:MAG: glycoside hydrolase family 32 protein [Treponema sp.]|nr:glycoside hydrolase family 32 protein [Treponema sp.]